MKQKTKKTNWKLLKKLAEISSIQARNTIRKRNKALLKDLEIAYNEWKKHGEVNKKIKHNIGCPHCNKNFNCHSCLWKYVSDYSCMPCCNVDFGGSSYFDLSTDFVKLAYGIDNCFLNVYITKYDDNVHIIEEYFSDVRNFLQAHIDWTYKYSWGTKSPPKNYRIA